MVNYMANICTSTGDSCACVCKSCTSLANRAGINKPRRVLRFFDEVQTIFSKIFKL